jgi:hypothetical protein
MNALVKLVFAHLLGDYVLQNDFIAKTKANNYYHLFVHCVLYCFPFYVLMGFTWHLIPLLIIHIIVDYLKCKKVINYTIDQIIHYITLLLYII